MPALSFFTMNLQIKFGMSFTRSLHGFVPETPNAPYQRKLIIQMLQLWIITFIRTRWEPRQFPAGCTCIHHTPNQGSQKSLDHSRGNGGTQNEHVVQMLPSHGIQFQKSLCQIWFKILDQVLDKVMKKNHTYRKEVIHCVC